MIGQGETRLIIDEAALQALLKSPTGPVARHLARVGAAIEGEAKQLATGELVNVQSGRYRSSISSKLFVRGNTIGVIISANAFYSKYLEFGTRHMSARPVMQTAARRILGPSVI